MSSVARARIWFAIKAVIAAAIIIYLIKMVEFSRMVAVMKSAKPVYIILGIVMSPLNLFWLVARWRYLVGYADTENQVGFKNVLGSALSGTTLRLTTPGGLGESARIFYIRGIGRMKLFALSVVDNMASFSITVIFGLLGVAHVTGITLFYYGPALYVLIVILVLNFRHKLDIPGWTFLHERIRNPDFWDTLKRIPVTRIIIVVIMAAAMYAVYVVQFFFFVRAFEKLVPVNGFAAITSIFLVKTLLPISFGDLGIRESASIYFLSGYGVSDAAALNAALLLFTFNLLFPAIAGAFFIPGLKFKAKKAD